MLGKGINKDPAARKGITNRLDDNEISGGEERGVSAHRRIDTQSH